jgi:hypothetical protein
VHNPEGNYLKLTSYIDGDYIYGEGKQMIMRLFGSVVTVIFGSVLTVVFGSVLTVFFISKHIKIIFFIF